MAGRILANDPAPPARRRSGVKWLILFVFVVLIAGAAWFETQTSLLQSMLFTRWAGEMSYHLVNGPSPSIRYPVAGPYDVRLGYNNIPQYVDALKQRGFAIDKQADQSPALNRFAARHGYALYPEKPTAGLQLRDRNGKLLYAASYPEQYYTDFSQIPSLIVATLLFIENHTLLEPTHPYQNPAVEWQRFLHAAGGQIEGMITRHPQAGGGSTLATQIEKYEHDPEGRTQGVFDKLLQMSAATTRAYMNGPNTLDARKRIVTSYINTTPLSSRAGYGEVIGIADGLKVWFGTDFATANRILSQPDSPSNLEQKATIYKEVLSLMIAERRPAYYLLQNHDDLEAEAESNLKLLAKAGVITPEFRDAAINSKLPYRPKAPAPAPINYVGQKASNSIRTELLGALNAQNLYALDRLDLNATTTIDAPVQQNVSRVLRSLKNPGVVNALGMVGFQLLSPSDDVSQLNYSVVIYEREADRNVLRVHGDTLDEPFDINSSSKLILGSTSKLRTMIAYLDICDHIYQQHLNDSPAQLRKAASNAHDPISQFVIGYLETSRKAGLKGLMQAAMQRTYSGSTAEGFFTGSGLQFFHNFESSEDSQVWTVHEAFAHSVNLAFIRLMRDVTSYYMAERAAHGGGVVENLDPNQREDYLKRFADQEGTDFLNHFYKDLKGKNQQQITAFMLQKAGVSAPHLAVIFRSLQPEAPIQQMRQFLAAHGVQADEKKILDLYETYGPDKMTLSDRGFIAHVHPLELWLGAYLVAHPDATRSEVIDASADKRQEAYGWLFNSKRAHQQNVRIRIITEEDAFNDLLPEWKKQGWPFDRLVPSLATAIGSSGDRPDALATLMGIIVNNGVRLPTTNIAQLQLAGHTPYESDLGFAPGKGQRLYPPELIAVVRKALEAVVQEGTAARLRGTYFNADNTPLDVGGKTGTSNNDYEHFAGGHLIGSEPRDRTATFVFFLGDKFYGTVTAFVRGKQSGNFKFTSALTVQLLKALAPQLQPLLGTPVNPNPLATVSTAQNGKGAVTASD
ncbi:MAG TPA: transglycosylase domain-containing protein [Micropepsaceae bacterium]|nr:transglycosylase domain-containing protein [Micropepsaceae bacterium]